MTDEDPGAPAPSAQPGRQAGDAELTDVQRRLLIRMWSRPVILSGEESDELRLAVLQLYTAGLVTQSGGRRGARAIEWRLTEDGRIRVQSLR